MARAKYYGPVIDANSADKDVTRLFKKTVGKKFYYQLSKGHELDKRQRRGRRKKQQRFEERWHREHGGGPEK